ncbi:MAG: TRAP transporter substrate-binding protein [Eubacteriales bacterium]|nr:TRAP transporter substrate-binding protein [Eubacteriales bacterium]
MKNKMRRYSILLAACLLLTLALAGCGKSAGSGDGTMTYAWPLGTSSPEDTVTQIYAERFAEEVSRLSDGKMRIQVYPNSILGGDRELLESCKDGDIPFVVQNTAPQVTFLPDIAVFDMPCLFDSIEDVRTHIDNPEFMDQVNQVYKNGGYELLGYADQGFRVMTSNKDVFTANDFRGQKIRTMENPYHLRFWKALGANPTPMTFSEVYIGLQQGTIDAQENPYEVIVSNRLYEQQDYVIETNHLPHLISLIVSDEFMQGLPEDQQAIIRQAAETAKEEARQASDDRIASRIATIEESGTQIIRLDEENRLVIRQKCVPVYDLIEENVSPSLVEAYCGKELEEIRAMVP